VVDTLLHHPTMPLPGIYGVYTASSHPLSHVNRLFDSNVAGHPTVISVRSTRVGFSRTKEASFHLRINRPSGQKQAGMGEETRYRESSRTRNQGIP